MALSLADAFGTVVVTQEQASALFGRIAEMVRDGSPELEEAFHKGAEAVLEYGGNVTADSRSENKEREERETNLKHTAKN